MPSAEMGDDAGVVSALFENRRYGYVSLGYVEALRAEVESPRSLVRSAVTTFGVPARTVTQRACGEPRHDLGESGLADFAAAGPRESAGKPPANERGVTRGKSMSPGDPRPPFLALATTLGDTQRYLSARNSMPLHGGGQGFDSPAVHQAFYCGLQALPVSSELPFRSVRPPCANIRQTNGASQDGTGHHSSAPAGIRVQDAGGPMNAVDTDGVRQLSLPSLGFR
jgi:hypothetical protein